MRSTSSAIDRQHPERFRVDLVAPRKTSTSRGVPTKRRSHRVCRRASQSQSSCCRTDSFHPVNDSRHLPTKYCPHLTDCCPGVVLRLTREPRFRPRRGTPPSGHVIALAACNDTLVPLLT